MKTVCGTYNTEDTYRNFISTTEKEEIDWQIVHIQKHFFGCVPYTHLQAWHSQSHILGGHTGKMESVQCHLRCGLSKRLRSNDSHTLSRSHQCRLESTSDFTQQPLEGLLVQSVLAQHTFGGQLGTQQHLEQEGGVATSLRVWNVRDIHGVAQFANLLNYLNGEAGEARVTRSPDTHI